MHLYTVTGGDVGDSSRPSTFVGLLESLDGGSLQALSIVRNALAHLPICKYRLVADFVRLDAEKQDSHLEEALAFLRSDAFEPVREMLRAHVIDNPVANRLMEHMAPVRSAVGSRLYPVDKGMGKQLPPAISRDFWAAATPADGDCAFSAVVQGLLPGACEESGKYTPGAPTLRACVAAMAILRLDGCVEQLKGLVAVSEGGQGVLEESFYHGYVGQTLTVFQQRMLETGAIITPEEVCYEPSNKYAAWARRFCFHGSCTFARSG